MTCVASHDHCRMCAHSIDDGGFKSGNGQRCLVLQQLPQLLQLPLLVEVLVHWQRCLVILNYLLGENAKITKKILQRLASSWLPLPG